MAVEQILPIYALTPFTMLDFSGRTSCIVWFSGCNMRCGYCHNPNIVRGKGKYGTERVIEFLKTRQGLLDGVVLSGGEATLYPALPDFVARLKGMGFAVKLDTNGTRPDMLCALLDDDLVDYVALDYKAPQSKHAAVTGCRTWDVFSRSLDHLIYQRKVPFEIRTTIHTSMLDKADIDAIREDLDTRGFSGTYYIQNFVADNDRQTLANMPDQINKLDTQSQRPYMGFTTAFRNFPAMARSSRKG